MRRTDCLNVAPFGSSCSSVQTFAVIALICGGVVLASLIGKSTPFMIGGIVLGIIVSILFRKILTIIGYILFAGLIGYMIFQAL